MIAVDRDAAGLASWDQHPHATALVCDLSDAEATGRAFEGLDEVDYLVNAAGVAIFEPVLELSVETWDVTTAINNRAPVQLTQAFAKQVHAPRGTGADCGGCSALRGAVPAPSSTSRVSPRPSPSVTIISPTPLPKQLSTRLRVGSLSAWLLTASAQQEGRCRCAVCRCEGERSQAHCRPHRACPQGTRGRWIQKVGEFDSNWPSELLPVCCLL